MFDSVLDDCKREMVKAKSVFESELSSIRTGRANPGILDIIKVDVFGSMIGISSLGSITVSDAKTLIITVWDVNNISSIDSAIRKSDLGFNPRVDGNKLFITLPDLTEDRRKEFIKIVKKKAENIKVRIRNIRRDFNDSLKKMEKDNELTEDDLKLYLDSIQKTTDQHIKDIDLMSQKKESDLLSI